MILVYGYALTTFHLDDFLEFIFAAYMLGADSICCCEKADEEQKSFHMLGQFQCKIDEILYAETLGTELEYRLCSEFCELLL